MEKLFLSVSRRTVVEFQMEEAVVKKLLADIGFILATTEDLPKGMTKDEAKPFFEVRARIESFFQNLRRVTQGEP